MQRCLGCMKEFGEEFDVCPYCGYIKDTPPKNKLHLPGGTMLAGGRYMLGKVLGYGGFGITYIAWDTTLNRAVAVKEFFPNAMSTRTVGEAAVSCYNDKAAHYFKEGVQKMLDEAKRISKFTKNENIVDVYDCFEENNTAYIVMEYLDGEDLMKYFKENGKRLPPEEAVKFILPVLNALEDMHSVSLIHRDISPDNIYLCEDGKVKLLDFGSARLAVEDSDKSFSIMLKKGYAPREQYASRSRQGPWTDVYAVCATLYQMITGSLPTESIERDTETLKSFADFGVEGYEKLEKVVFKGLEVEVNNRTQSARELKIGLEEALKKEPEQPEKDSNNTKKRKVNVKAIVALAAVVILVAAGAFVGAKMFLKNKGEKEKGEGENTPAKKESVVLDEAQAKNIYEAYLSSYELKTKYPVINAFIGKDASLCEKEALQSFGTEISDLSKAEVKKEFYDLDGDSTPEMLLSLAAGGEGAGVRVYVFDMDGEQNVFGTERWNLSPADGGKRLSVMKDENNKYFFIEYAYDGTNEKNCEKLIYDGEKIQREISLSFPDYMLTGCAMPEFAKCVSSEKSLTNENEYPTEEEIEYLTYGAICDEWAQLFSQTRVTGYCDSADFTADGKSTLCSAVALKESGKASETIEWKRYESGYLMFEGTGKILRSDSSSWAKNHKEVISVGLSEGITNIGESAFSEFGNLKSVMIPDSVTSIGGSAFNGCTSLASVTIGNSVTDIGGSAFSDCTSLESVTIGNSVTDIGAYAFSDCTSLESVTIPNSVTSIGGGTFSDCTNLKSVTIPIGVTEIQEGAFGGCENLTDVYYKGARIYWLATTVGTNNDPLLNAQIHYYS